MLPAAMIVGSYVGVLVGVRVGVDVGVPGGVGVFVPVGVGVPVFVAVGVGVGGQNVTVPKGISVYSNAPISQPVPCGRGIPR